jgi:hypothetical protein
MEGKVVTPQDLACMGSDGDLCERTACWVWLARGNMQVAGAAHRVGYICASGALLIQSLTHCLSHTFNHSPGAPAGQPSSPSRPGAASQVRQRWCHCWGPLQRRWLQEQRRQPQGSGVCRWQESAEPGRGRMAHRCHSCLHTGQT